MGYVVEGDIRARLGSFYSDAWPPAGGKPPTVADGLALADQASGQIDAILSGRGLVVPITIPATFLKELAGLAALYAAAVLASELTQIMPNAAETGGRDHPEFLMRAWLDGISALRTDPLPDAATQTTPGGMGRSFWTSNPDYFATDHLGTAGNQTDPVIRRDTAW